jgi:ABC-type branched-subunit amino acid transport system ATPase component
VILFGQNMVGAKPHTLAQAGLGRTFQIMRPFARMTVAENVLVGAYVGAADEDEAIAHAQTAIRRVGLAASADKIAGGLTTKELRLMEIARALAGRPQILLLDETLAGLGSGEVDDVIAIVRRLAEEGITIVIIEHTMHAMVRLVDRFVVLDHGTVLSEDVPEAVTRDPRVVEAYLGKKWIATHAQH